MGDGCWTRSGIRIATNCFQLKEVERLKETLEMRYKIKTTIQKLGVKDMYSLYIKKESVNNVRKLIMKEMHESMLYKIGIDKKIKVLSTHTKLCDSREK